MGEISIGNKSITFKIIIHYYSTLWRGLAATVLIRHTPLTPDRFCCVFWAKTSSLAVSLKTEVIFISKR